MSVGTAVSSLFETATSFLGGIKVYLIIGASCLAVGFGSGYCIAVNQAEKNASVAPAKAAIAQKAHDDKQQVVARKVSNESSTFRIAERRKLEIMYAELPSILVVDKDCKFTADAIRLLNEAGK